MDTFLDTPIEYLKTVGPQRAKILQKEAQIFNFEDLLFYFPFRYVDRSRFTSISELNNESTYVQIKGRVVSKEIVGEKFKSRLLVRFADATGEIDLLWFNGIKWNNERLLVGESYVIFGKPNLFRQKYSFTHPEIDPLNEKSVLPAECLYPMYLTTEKMKNAGLNSKAISKLLVSLLQNHPQDFPEVLPADVTDKYQLFSRNQALRGIHFPRTQEELVRAQNRIKFEELFFLQIRILKEKSLIQKTRSNSFAHVGSFFHRFYAEKLPFTLTGAQQKVVREIREDMRTGFQMNRLLQGDVGSGKTLVALLSMLIAADNGFQSCLMAPTEILAQQHFKTLQNYLQDLGIGVALLTGSSKTKARRDILQRLEQGELHILVGTHAVIEDKVVFQRLGLCIIDEQHRFGVAQRARLWNKSETPPHILVMTATPIPRTLAMTLYGDLDQSVIDELPPNRKAIRTLHRDDSQRHLLYAFMKQEILKGRQVYIVYPLIKESEKLDLRDLEEGYHHICAEFPRPNFQVSILHGKMPQAEKDLGMRLFQENRCQIMVSTTVIEVGVDVPNATVMVIENAERFGLSQLHQLRGRVGRGGEQSYCVLMSGNKLGADARLRIETMVRSNDGFQIAEVDLQLRGPGDLQGTQQSGSLPFRLADLVRDEKFVRAARVAAYHVLEKDPQLQSEDYRCIWDYLRAKKLETSWSKIS